MSRTFIPSPAFPAARAAYDALQADLAAASHDLRSVPGIGTGPMGLTPDSVRARPDWQSANARYQAAHNAARRFNGPFARTFKRELAAERDARRAALIAAH